MLKWNVLLVVLTVGMLQSGLGAAYQTVLDMKPIGYWPVDEGCGDVLNDRSGNDNHGKIFHTPWKNGLLDFTSGYQWAEIPDRAEYRSADFTMGGWLFSRRDDYVSGGGQASGLYFFGNTTGPKAAAVPDAQGAGLSLGDVSGGLKISVRSGGKDDAIGSMSGRVSIDSGQWQHVLYTCEAGTGKLYLNGQLVAQKAGVTFTAAQRAFIIGADASWWMVHPPPARSLDGSVKEMVVFSRALTPEDVTRLYTATRPDKFPEVYPSGSVRLDAKTIQLEQLLSFTIEERRRALDQLAKRPPAELYRTSEFLLPILGKSLNDWQTRRIAVHLLVKLNSAPSRAILTAAVPKFIQTLGDQKASREERAASALGLAEMKAPAAVPVLLEVLGEMKGRDGTQAPRVEEVLRNSVLSALLNIDPVNGPVSEILGRALPKGNGECYFSQGDVHRDARGQTPN